MEAKSKPHTWNRRLAIVLVAGLTAGFAQFCWSYDLRLDVRGMYDELVDRGPITITASVGYDSPGPLHFVPDCDATVTSFVGAVIRIDMKLKPGGASQAPCFNVAKLSVGPVAVGEYSATARLLDVDGQTLATVQTTFSVAPLAGRCNAHPQISPQMIVVPAMGTAAQFQQRLLTDPAYAALMGNPIVVVPSDFATLEYPPLVNPTELRAKLEDTGQFEIVEENAALCAIPPPPSIGTATEYFNAALQHYFYTSDSDEKDVLRSGAIAGWSETGEAFAVTNSIGCIPYYPTGNPAVVYRFYGSPAVGTGTHFFTISRDECHAVDRSQQWTYEGIAFWAAEVAADGSCSKGLQPLYRAWRPFGDSEHRYSTKPAVIEQMVAQGWVSEGAVMCVPGT